MAFRSLAIGVSLFALIAGTEAFAQEVADTGEPEIVVTGQRAQQQRSIEIKRESIGIVDVAASDEIGQLPDRNVAEVIERLPGVGVQYDQGEGRYVAIRGIPSDLNNYTVNGFELGNPDGNTRRLPLDIVSGQLLNRVEVTKAKTAELDGQGIGGTVNLVTQTAFDFKDPFVVSVTAQAGYQTLNEKVPVRADASIGGRFGSDEQFGILVGASYSKRDFQSFGLYPDDWALNEDAARGAAPINIKYNDYNLERERIGGIASFDWQATPSTRLYVRGLYSKFTENEYRQRYRLDFATAAQIAAGTVSFNPDGLTGVSRVTEQRSDLRLEYKEKSVLIGMIGGRTETDDWVIDYGGARSHNEVIEPNQLWQFRGNPGVVDFDFSDKLFTATPRMPLTANGLQFRQYSEQDESGDEYIWTGKLDVTRKLAFGDDSFIRVGGKYRATDKDFDSNNTVYMRGSGAATRFSLGQFDLAGEDVSSYPRKGRPYLITPVIDADKIVDFTADPTNSKYFVLDEGTSLANATLNDLDLSEKIAAGYAMANIDFGAISITPGLRIERTELSIRGFQLENGDDVVPVSGKRSYTDWLPSLMMRFRPNDEVVVRLAYTRSVGRPNYSDLTPGGETAYEENGDGTFDGSVSVGNPNLAPYVSDALDASAEWYFARGGLISVGVFAKFIDNPIYTESVTLTDTSYGGRDYARLEFSQRQNGTSADIIGLEVAYRQQFEFLPGFLSGFGLEANATLIDSTLKVDGRGEPAGFPEQSKLLYGAQLFYQKGPIEASVAYHHTGRALIALGGEALTDQYNDDLRRLDAKASFALTPNIRLFVEGQNLTDEPTRQYQGGRRDWIIQNERYGRTYYAGASVQF
ncbi:TonB-dependent receptor [Sphingomonas zeicaulis]|uniref:TonB-dependent receptor n=1 Tax=Sphingomonas zeicaulis TaxID=1632740 RepID=UPI003D194BF2